MEVNSGGKGARCDVDHSARLLARLFDMLNTAADTCDVTFVVSDLWPALPVADDCSDQQQTGTLVRARTRPRGGGSREERSRSHRSTARTFERHPSGEGGHSRRPQEETAGTARDGGHRVRGASAEAAGEEEGGRGGEGGGEGCAEGDPDVSRAPTADGIDLLAVAAAKAAATATTTVSGTSSAVADRSVDGRSCSGRGSSQKNTKEFPCHRILFASCSEYFRALLYGGMSESQTRRVELRDVAPQVFESIVRYVYTGKVVVDSGKEARNVDPYQLYFEESQDQTRTRTQQQLYSLEHM